MFKFTRQIDLFLLPLQLLLLIFFRQRFIDLCEGKIPVGNMTLMKDISLTIDGAKGEYLYNKVQHISYDDVFATYMTYPRVSMCNY